MAELSETLGSKVADGVTAAKEAVVWTPSEKILELAEEWINPSEAPKIRDILLSVPESEREAVFNEIQEEAEEPVKAKLAALRADFEKFKNPTYGLEWIIDTTSSETFKKTLPLYQKWLHAVTFSEWENGEIEQNIWEGKLSQVLWKNIEMLSEQHGKTIEVVLWKSLTSNLTIPNLVKQKLEEFTGKMTGFFSWIGEKFKKAGEQTSEEDTPKFDKILGLLDAFKGASGDVSNFSVDKNKDIVLEAQEFMSSLIKTELKNLSILWTLLVERTPAERDQILTNPQVLSELLKHGSYEDDNIVVDLESGKIDITNTLLDTEISAVQTEFMKQAAIESDKKWSSIQSKINGVKDMLKKVEYTAEKLGISPADLGSMKEKLYKLPIIGFFIKLMLGGAFDGIQKNLEVLWFTEERKNASKNLSQYLDTKTIVSGSNKITYTPAEWEEKLRTTALKKFFDQIESVNEAHGEKTPEGKTPLNIDITSDTFWKTLFNDTLAEAHPDMLQIREKVLEKITKKSQNGAISQKELVAALNEAVDGYDAIEQKVSQQEPKISVEQKTAQAPQWQMARKKHNIQNTEVAESWQIGILPGAVVVPGVLADLEEWTIDATEEIEIPSIQEQFTNIQSLPLEITEPSGEKVMVNISGDQKEIIIWDTSYPIILILKNKDGEETFFNPKLKLNDEHIQMGIYTQTTVPVKVNSKEFSPTELSAAFTQIRNTGSYINFQKNQKDAWGHEIRIG